MYKRLKTKMLLCIGKYNSLSVAVKASLWFAICSIVQKGISVITMPIFTRLMSTEEFGQYNIFLTWYNIFLLIITLNVHSEIFNKGLIDNDDKKNEFTANQTGLLIFLSLVSILLYLPFREYINSWIGMPTFLVIILVLEILGASIIALWFARKRFDFEYGIIVKLTLAMSLITPIIGVVSVLLSSYKAEAKIISNAIVPVIVAIFLLCVIKKYGALFGHWDWWKKSIIAAIPLLPHYLSLVLLNQSDKLMINAFCGAEKAAIYSVAHSAGLLMTIVNNSINSSFVPWAYNKMKLSYGEGIKSAASKLLVVVFIANISLILIAPEAISLLAPSQYAEAVYCLVPIAISVYFYFTYTMFVDIEIYYGANHFVALASIVAAGLNLLLNYIFIPKFGYLAAGYTTLVSYFFTMVMHYVFLKWTLAKNKFTNVLFSKLHIISFGVLLIGSSAIIASLYSYTYVRYLVFIAFLVYGYRNRNKYLINKQS
ncbi:oligosaccharide flippase family protein [Phascolarctobacterium succinatutens]